MMGENMGYEIKFWNGKNFVITSGVIRDFNKRYPVDGRYKNDEEILKNAVGQLIQPGSSLNQIYHVATLINAFYSTRMGGDDCFKVSGILYDKHKDIMGAMNTGDVDVVQDVINIQQEKLGRVAFSFTTKYFSVLCRYRFGADRFPIYDSLVAHLLDFYYGSGSRVTKTHKDYLEYCKCINEVIPKGVAYKELDDFLWTLGRKINHRVSKITADDYNYLMEPKLCGKNKEKTSDGKRAYSVPIGSGTSPTTMARILSSIDWEY